MVVKQIITYVENTAAMINQLGNNNVLSVIPLPYEGGCRILILYKEEIENNEKIA